MTSLPDRTGTALLVIDMQVGVLNDAHDVDRVVANINALITKARSEDAPVIWVQHSDDGLPMESESWQYVSELIRHDDEPLVHKRYGDSFEGTDLESILSDRHIGHVVVTGAQTDACIRSTLHGALAHGYDATLVGDAHTTEDMRPWGSPISPEQAIAYTNLYWSFSTRRNVPAPPSIPTRSSSSHLDTVRTADRLGRTGCDFRPRFRPRRPVGADCAGDDRPTPRKESTVTNVIGKMAQVAAPLWIFNVWFNRFNKDTGYRGGDAKNMKEEFQEYGLSERTMYAVGAAKVGLATLMLVGLFVPRLTRPASGGLAALMLGAIGMHIKVDDPVKRYLPALSVFSLSALSALLSGDRD